MIREITFIGLLTASSAYAQDESPSTVTDIAVIPEAPCTSAEFDVGPISSEAEKGYYAWLREEGHVPSEEMMKGLEGLCEGKPYDAHINFDEGEHISLAYRGSQGFTFIYYPPTDLRETMTGVPSRVYFKAPRNGAISHYIEAFNSGDGRTEYCTSIDLHTPFIITQMNNVDPSTDSPELFAHQSALNTGLRLFYNHPALRTLECH